MSSSKAPAVSSHYDAVAAEYHQQYQRDNLFTSEDYPANYFRLQILTQILATTRSKRVYEIGVGEGTPLVTMSRMGFDVSGCDISTAMVSKAQENFQKNGLSPKQIAWGDIEDSTTIVQQIEGGQFDAVIAAGVLPHIRNDHLFLKNVQMFLKPGGKALIEFRNKLFSLFTMNRHTKEFILDDLLKEVSPDVKTQVAAELDRRFAVDLPPVRTHQQSSSGTSAPGYDAILSKFHNPFELTETFAKAGFSNIKIHWYHYHAAPPMMERAMGDQFRRASMSLEHEGSWRGNFLCSAGVVEADYAG